MSNKITKRKDGRFVTTYTVKCPDGSSKRQYLYGHSREDLKRKRDKEVAAMIMGQTIIHNKLTLEMYLKEWTEKNTYLRKGTLCSYKGVFRKHVIPYIGKVKMYKLRTSDIQMVINRHLNAGGSVRVAQLIRDNLSSALKQAVVDGIIPKNIARDVNLPSYQPKEREVWTAEETQRFYSALQEHPYRFIYELILTYGLRRGEAIAVSWEDVDLENDIIHIRKQYTSKGDGEWGISEVKTKNSCRDLPLLPHIRQMLEEMRKQSVMNGPIVANNGEMIKPPSIDWHFEKIKKENGLRDVTLHSLRHFAATAFKDLGISIKDAQLILGHASPATTINNYQHSTLGNKKEALTKYAETMGF